MVLEEGLKAIGRGPAFRADGEPLRLSQRCLPGLVSHELGPERGGDGGYSGVSTNLETKTVSLLLTPYGEYILSIKNMPVLHDSHGAACPWPSAADTRLAR